MIKVDRLCFEKWLQAIRREKAQLFQGSDDFVKQLADCSGSGPTFVVRQLWLVHQAKGYWAGKIRVTFLGYLSQLLRMKTHANVYCTEPTWTLPLGGSLNSKKICFYVIKRSIDRKNIRELRMSLLSFWQVMRFCAVEDQEVCRRIWQREAGPRKCDLIGFSSLHST